MTTLDHDAAATVNPWKCALCGETMPGTERWRHLLDHD